MAVLDQDDPKYSSALKAWTAIIKSQEIMITSNYVMVETISLLHRRFGTVPVKRFQEDILPVMNVEWVDEELHGTGANAVLGSGKRGPSLVDCVSFEIIRKERITRVFA